MYHKTLTHVNYYLDFFSVFFRQSRTKFPIYNIKVIFIENTVKNLEIIPNKTCLLGWIFFAFFHHFCTIYTKYFLFLICALFSIEDIFYFYIYKTKSISSISENLFQGLPDELEKYEINSFDKSRYCF